MPNPVSHAPDPAAPASESLKKTFSHSAIYGLGIVLAKLTSVVMLPIYTRYLAPADYGLLELLSMITDLTALIFGMRIFRGVYRYYFDSNDPRRQSSVIATALCANVILHGLGVVFLVAFSRPAAVLVMKDAVHQPLVIAFAFSLLTMSLITVPMLYIRAQQRPWLYLAVSGTKLLLQLSLNIFFVVYLRWGPAGIVASTLITGGVMGIGLSVWALRRTGWTLSAEIARKLAAFGWPLMASNLFAFYITFGDRFFIQHYWNLTELGLYALAYQFGFALYAVGFGTFMQIWSTESYIQYNRGNATAIFQRFFLIVTLGLVVAGTGVSVFAHEILEIMADPAFLPAHRMVPVLILAYVIKAASDYCGFSISIGEKTRHFLQASAIATMAITVGYVVLIPRFGALGAAGATVMGMLAELWWIVRSGKQYFDMQLPWRKATGALSGGVLVYAIAAQIEGSLLVVVALKLALMLAFTGALFLSPLLTAADRASVVQLLPGAWMSFAQWTRGQVKRPAA